MTTPEPPPEAQLIKRLREEIVPTLSMREAAHRARFSPSTWAHIEHGRKSAAPGVVIPIRGTADNLAAMALVVGATQGQLREAGRDDAAVVLGRMLDAAPDPTAEMVAKIRASTEFTEVQKRLLIEKVVRDAPVGGS